MRLNIFSGSAHLFKGITLIQQPQLRRYVIIPALINVVMFIIGITLLVGSLDPYVEQLLSYLPAFLQWLSGVLWLVLTLLVVVVVFFVISMISGIVAAPFNSLLAEAVEQSLTGQHLETTSTTELIKQTPHLIMEELRKLLYFIIRAIPLLILFVIPGINIVAPFIWFVFVSWVLALNYLSYPLENHQMSFKTQRGFAARNRLGTLGFGLTVTLLTMVPLLNFLIIPAAVAGATSFYMDAKKGE